MIDNAGLGLEWTVTPGDQATVVHATGAIDLATLDMFDQAVRAGLATSSPIVVLDLGKVTFLGSIGLRVLVQAHDEAQRAGRAVRIVHGITSVRRIMEVTGLDQVLSLYPTIEEAAQSA